MTDEDSSQMWTLLTARYTLGYFGSNLLLDLLRYGFSINDIHDMEASPLPLPRRGDTVIAEYEDFFFSLYYNLSVGSVAPSPWRGRGERPLLTF